ncbi:hypothetical protein ACEPAF_5185 [Sanghuangporus sanghuang]
MPSTITTSASTAKVSETQKIDTVKPPHDQEGDSLPGTAGDISREESLLKEYSKELYVYTLDLLNSARIDNAHKGVNGKAYMLKRTVSDIAVPLKTMAIGGDAAKAAKGAVVPA